MRLADSSRAKLSRFRILELLSEGLFGFTCIQLAKRSGLGGWEARSFQASLATRLRRLRALGLVNRELDKFARTNHSRRIGVFRWRISERGAQRLEWAKSKELV